MSASQPRGWSEMLGGLTNGQREAVEVLLAHAHHQGWVLTDDDVELVVGHARGATRRAEFFSFAQEVLDRHARAAGGSTDQP